MGNNIVILHIKRVRVTVVGIIIGVRIIEAVDIIMDGILRHLPLFAACTIVEEELLSIVA